VRARARVNNYQPSSVSFDLQANESKRVNVLVVVYRARSRLQECKRSADRELPQSTSLFCFIGTMKLEVMAVSCITLHRPSRVIAYLNTIERFDTRCEGAAISVINDRAKVNRDRAYEYVEPLLFN